MGKCLKIIMIKQVLMHFVQYGFISLDIVPSFPFPVSFYHGGMVSGHQTLPSAVTFSVCVGHNLKVNQGTSLQAIPRM